MGARKFLYGDTVLITRRPGIHQGHKGRIEKTRIRMVGDSPPKVYYEVNCECSSSLTLTSYHMDIFDVSLDRAAVDLVTPIEANQRFFLKTLGVNTDHIISPVILQNKTDEALAPLSLRQRDIVILRNGLNGGRRYPLQVIADSDSVTKERIRQIEARAMKNLRPKG